MEKPTKPITMLISEFGQSIVKIINESTLPMWKKKDELEKILSLVNQACTDIEQREYAEYAQALKEYEESEVKENG